jgi:HSP20 family protein
MLPILKNRWSGFTDEFFGNTLSDNFFNRYTKISVPAVNIAENKEDFRIEIAAPGLEKADFRINLENNILAISSEKENKEKEKEDNYMCKEFNYTSFCRTFSLPETAQSDKIVASHKNGILYITIPKKEEAKVKAPRQIAVA